MEILREEGTRVDARRQISDEIGEQTMISCCEATANCYKRIIAKKNAILEELLLCGVQKLSGREEVVKDVIETAERGLRIGEEYARDQG